MLDIWMITDRHGMPVLVKYNEKVSYLPVFESEVAAREAARNLGGTSNQAVNKGSGSYVVLPFEWNEFREFWNRSHGEGIMLFVYPMSKSDYGGKE